MQASVEVPVDLGRPKLTMSSQSREGPRNPVEETTTNLWMSCRETPASAIAFLHTSVTRGTETNI